MNSAMKDLRIGLVFSGGFAKGAYEIGFCKAIMEYTKMEIILENLLKKKGWM